MIPLRITANQKSPDLSEAFQQLYCDAAVFENFSARLPVRFTRVLPFQAADPVVDDARLLAAEAALLARPDAATRLAVVEALAQCGLLSAEDAANLKPVLDDFDGEYAAEFFELMGDLHANAGMFICALRWYREYLAVREPQLPGTRSDTDEVYASVGHCLQALGLFAEAVAWTKSCLGPDWMGLTVASALVDYQAQLLGGRLLATERASNRTRYTASATQDAEVTRQTSDWLKSVLKTLLPFHEFYFDWVSADAPAPPIPEGSYPFKFELDSGCLPRHKMNLLFALCGQADELSARGLVVEARRLLQEASLLEPQAEFVQAKIQELQ